MKLPWWATTLDTLAVVLGMLVLSVAFTGGFRVWFFDLELSVTGWWRPALWCTAAVAIRHALLRDHPLPQAVAARLTAWWRADDTRAVLPVFLASRAGVLFVGFLAVLFIGIPVDSPRWGIYSNHFLDLPARWDTGWYLGIALQGYKFDPGAGIEVQQNIAFFPAFPMAMRYLSAILGHHLLWTGVGISLVAFFCALIYFLRLARLDAVNDDASVMGLTFLATYPFAVFYSVPYTEGLFLLTLVASIYHFRQGQLVRAALWGLLCGLTRPNGCLQSIVLGLMAAAPLWDVTHRRVVLPPPGGWGALSMRLAVAAMPGIGMLAYSSFILDLTGNAFMWSAQNAAWGRVSSQLAKTIFDSGTFLWNHGLYHFAVNQPTNFVYWMVLFFAWGSIWPVYRRFGLPYAALILVNTLPPLLLGGLLSMGRLTSVLFPTFMWMGLATPARHRVAWLCLFAVLQGFVAAAFFTWRPLY